MLGWLLRKLLKQVVREARGSADESSSILVVVYTKKEEGERSRPGASYLTLVNVNVPNFEAHMM